MTVPGLVYGYDDLVDRVEIIRQRIHGMTIIGLAGPDGITPDAIGYANLKDTWAPFSGIHEQHGLAVLMLPGVTHTVDPQRIAAIRLIKLLGGRFLIVVGYCTALRARIPERSVVLIADHVNLTGENPLVGSNDDRIGPRFSSMTEPYDLRLLDRAERSALEGGITAPRCVFAGVGASPTPAECRYLANTGADIYGFGIISDTIIAQHAGLPVIAAADVIARRVPEGPVSQDTVQADTAALSDNLLGMVERLVRSLH